MASWDNSFEKQKKISRIEQRKAIYFANKNKDYDAEYPLFAQEQNPSDPRYTRHIDIGLSEISFYGKIKDYSE